MRSSIYLTVHRTPGHDDLVSLWAYSRWGHGRSYRERCLVEITFEHHGDSPEVILARGFKLALERLESYEG